jgi:hypothetical protein
VTKAHERPSSLAYCPSGSVKHFRFFSRLCLTVLSARSPTPGESRWECGFTDSRARQKFVAAPDRANLDASPIGVAERGYGAIETDMLSGEDEHPPSFARTIAHACSRMAASARGSRALGESSRATRQGRGNWVTARFASWRPSPSRVRNVRRIHHSLVDVAACCAIRADAGGRSTLRALLLVVRALHEERERLAAVERILDAEVVGAIAFESIRVTTFALRRGRFERERVSLPFTA